MDGSLVYFFDIWVGGLTGQDAILGMDFILPAGIWLDLAYGSISLSDENFHIEIGQSMELQLHLRMSYHEKFWVTRGYHWVPTVMKDLRRRRYLQITKIGDKRIIPQKGVRVGIWVAGDHIQGFVSVGPRRYMEWQNLALEALVEGRSEQADLLAEPIDSMVDRPVYPLPCAVLKQPEISQVQVSRSPLKDVERGKTSDRLDPAETSVTQVDLVSRTDDQLLTKSFHLILPQTNR
ncbi:Hypothetical protein PHPALM_11592 [Phytophthora palmivora]|uniref:Aspartic protease n=1 Tax=Phytophthora palmivora TaxID=4796 RepID=A0A2P4Y1V6_9STRA|nr:Hypothetical protein PHPALM_11592 [Phytophthora palmivora]